MNVERLILASTSPRRGELLARVCPEFEVDPCPLDEPQRRPANVPPRQWAEALAYFKVRSTADRHPGCWILGADTLVACGGELLGKPRDLADARRMLELQARQVSEVITGVSLVRRESERRRIARSEVSRVWMRDNPVEREAYLGTGDWEGKAGAYGIQSVGDRLVERVEGSFSNVVGLPLELVAAMLRSVGFSVQVPPNDRSRTLADTAAG